MRIDQENIKKLCYRRFGTNLNEDIAANLGVSKYTVNKWFKEKNIPLLRMYQIHYLLVN